MFGMKKECCDNVYREAADSDERERNAFDLRRRLPAADSFVDYPDRKQDQRDPVYEGSQYFQPVIAEGFSRCRGPAAKPDRR